MHAVTRSRRPAASSLGLSRRSRRRIRLAVAGVAALAVAGIGGSFANAATTQLGFLHAGQVTSKGQVLPTGQLIKPLGDRLVTANGKIMSSTISPDGRYLAALISGQYTNIAMNIIDLQTYKVVQTIGATPNANLQIASRLTGQEGPTYSPDGKFLWMPQQDGYSRFPVNADGTVGAPTAINIPVVGSQHALPAQAVYSADGSTVYAAVNGQNRVVALDAATGAIIQSWNVGIAPRDLAFVGSKLYVSNEGGRPATSTDTTMPSYGTQVPANPKTGSTTTGTVSVINTATPDAPAKSIDVGLHPTALHAAKGAVFVTDTVSDEVSVINTATDKVTQTITTRPWASASVGYEPNGVTLTNDGHLLVTLGRANAVAVYKYRSPKQPVSYVGLVPTDYYPENIATDGGKIIVTNLRGIDDQGTDAAIGTVGEGADTTTVSGKNSREATGTLNRFSLPSDQEIRTKLTPEVFAQNGWTNNDLKEAKGSKAKPVPVPVRLGDPSTIKYVWLIIKENRTYDQVFGDDPRGNGDPSLTQFGENATPNQHALEQQFGLYDNFYDMATNSTDGHNWLIAADTPEYMESSAGEFVRTGNGYADALGSNRSGYLWTSAAAAGKTARSFGEAITTQTQPANSTWQNLYCDAENMEKTGADSAYTPSTSALVPSLDAIDDHSYPVGDLTHPDIYRYEMWKKDFDKNGPANLNLVALPQNHTGGAPVNPIAQVADNDLTVGKMVDTISHSKYWKQSAIFVVEDDTQNGVDHVDGMRAPVEIISPYAKRGVVDDHYYNQLTVLRTIEQMLGMQPLNERDTAATPMYDAFTSKPNFTPYTALPNRIPLTYGLTTPPSCGYDQVPAQYANLVSRNAPTVPASEEKTAALWKTWASQQKFSSKTSPQLDSAPPELMDRYTWYEEYGFTKPYPGDKKIFTPSQVPGGAIPGSDSDG